MLYKNNLTTADQNVKIAREKHTEKKLKLLGLQVAVKNAQRNAALIENLVKRKKVMTATSHARGTKSKQSDALEGDRAAARVKDVIGCLDKVAEKRRELHNQKKSGQITSTWLASHPDLSTSFKKSIWRRMHRRKLQVVLRPSTEYFCQDIRSQAASLVESSKGGEKNDEIAATEEKMIKAEQAFLLASHPLTDSSASTVPTSKSTEAWAEPGWRLDLSVPDTTEQQSGLLPRAPMFPVLERNLAEVSSVPGLQAASFLSATHLRSLGSPLSTFAIMSSPAEIPTVLETQVKPEDIEGDPFNTTAAEMKIGYNFSLKTNSPPRVNSQNRKKVPVKDESDRTTANKTVTTTEKPVSSSGDKPEKKRRTSKSSTDPSPRKRKKTESSTATSNNTTEQAPATSHQASRKPASLQSQSRSKPPQVQTQQLQPNQGQQSNFPSPHQHSQQMAQLRMMPQARPGQVPPGAGYQPPGSLQQMQQFYAPLGHQNGPSPRAPQYRSSMSPNVARMQGTGGNNVSIPMHQGLAMPGSGQQNVAMGARTMGTPVPSNHSMSTVGGSGNQKARNRNAAMNGPSGSNSTQHPQQNQQDGSGVSKQDQNDPLFMLK